MAELLAAAPRDQGSSHVGRSEVNQGMLEFAGWEPVYWMVLPTLPWVFPPQFILPGSNFTNTPEGVAPGGSKAHQEDRENEPLQK